MTEVRKLTVLLLVITLVTGFLLPMTVHGSEAKLRTYIVYDSPNRFGSVFPLVTALQEYLAHFALDCRMMPLSKWYPGALQDAELIVFVGLKNTVLPREVLQEMTRANRIIWFEKNIEQLAAFLKWQDFQLDEVSNGWTHINYKKDLPCPDWHNVVAAQPGQQARILATVNNIADSRPLAWQRDNVYFCGLLNTDPFFMAVLGDLLHQFVPSHNHSHSQAVLLRIEDVSPLTDPKAINAVVAIINNYRIPFAIGVIPVGSNGSNKTYLHEKPELVRLLKEAQDNGASIIMHGYTHQNEYSPQTGEGYEFWNARDDKPMENDEEFTSGRIEAGIAELVRCGLIPLAFEPPHYAMSATGYKVLSRYFNIFSGQVQITDRGAEQSITLPYLAESAYLNGMLIIPENMGYYDGKTFLVEHMLHSSEQIAAVQDGFACFFYHGYLPPDKLPAIIEGVQNQGYSFFDLRQLLIRVRSPQIKIAGQNGQINVEIDKQLEKYWGNMPTENNVIEKVSKVHVLSLLIIIGMLIFIIIRLRVNAHKQYER